jgi:hypothetical protein
MLYDGCWGCLGLMVMGLVGVGGNPFKNEIQTQMALAHFSETSQAQSQNTATRLHCSTSGTNRQLELHLLSTVYYILFYCTELYCTAIPYHYLIH